MTTAWCSYREYEVANLCRQDKNKAHHSDNDALMEEIVGMPQHFSKHTDSGYFLQKSAHWSDPLAFASGREIGNFALTEAKLSSLSLINLTRLTLFCRPVVKDCQHVNKWGKMKEMRTELEKKGRMGRNYLVDNPVVNLVLCHWWRHISEMV